MLKKILNTQELNFSSSRSQDDLTSRLNELFQQESAGLEGKFTSKNEFTAYDKLVIIGWDMPNLHRKSAYLKGTITKGEKGTLLGLKVIPNSILPIFAVLAGLAGIIIALITLLKPGHDQYILIFGLIMLALGLIYYPLSTLFRNRLLNKVLKNLELVKA